MAAWLVLVLVGIAALGFGLWRFVSRLQPGRRVNRASIVMGTLFPVGAALLFSSVLFGIFPGLTIIDTAALFAVGMVSGFFLGVYVLQAKLDRERGAEQ